MKRRQKREPRPTPKLERRAVKKREAVPAKKAERGPVAKLEIDADES